MNFKYIEQALCFHGAPMQKIWDDERGADDLQRHGIPAQPNYDIYQQRQRFFTFQDRAKRLKLHQFFARKATDLYDDELKKYANIPDEKYLEKAKTSFITMPPYEAFAYDPQDKNRKWHAILESLKPGDIVYGICNKKVNATNLIVKLLCTDAPIVRYLGCLSKKGIILPQDLGPLPLDKNGEARGYLLYDIVRCEVLRISIDADRIFLGFNGVYKKDSNLELGLVKSEDLPLYYNNASKCDQKYEEYLKQSKEFLNPNYEVLYSMNGLDINDTFSMMGSLKLPFPQHEMAKELRKAQAHKWAFRSVAEGIELFKKGHHLEAFQCLNKALSIDPYNVEGLVARGALFANRGSFHKAVDDFGTALKLDKFHANARKYMGETLVALGRSLEEEKHFDEAAKAYKDCLELIPNHAQAMGCLEALHQRLTRSLLDSTFFDNLLNIPATTSKSKSVKPTISSSSKDSSSDSDSSDSDEDATDAKVTSSKFQKEASLSPLSKRLALHAANMRGFEVSDSTSMNAAPPAPNIASVHYDQPFFTARAVSDANDFRLDDDDTQSRVLKLIEQASAHKKNKKKKTKKNKSKKSKKVSKKSKNESNEVSSNIQQSLFQRNYLLETFKNIGKDNFQHKLSKDINSYEHKIAEIQKRQEMLRQSITTGTETATNTTDFDVSPPTPPSWSLIENTEKIHATCSQATKDLTNKNSLPQTTATSKVAGDANRFSFQLIKPIKVDKFGLVRIATPLKQRSPSLTRDTDKTSRRRSTRSRSRSQSYLPHRHSRRHRSSKSRSHSRSRRSRSSSDRRRRHRHTRSHSKSRSKSYYRSRRDSRDSRSHRHDSRSPYLKRRSRSRSNDYKKNSSRKWKNRTVSHAMRSPTSKSKNNFKNRVWQRPGYATPASNKSTQSKASDQRWQHDKFDDINNDQPPGGVKKEEGPSIEEIDEIINKAQKERKAEIIKRDKELLKRPSNQY